MLFMICRYAVRALRWSLLPRIRHAFSVVEAGGVPFYCAPFNVHLAGILLRQLALLCFGAQLVGMGDEMSQQQLHSGQYVAVSPRQKTIPKDTSSPISVHTDTSSPLHFNPDTEHI